MRLVDDKITARKNAEIPYVGLENIPSRGAHLLGWQPASASISTNAIFSAGDVLFGKLRPNLRKCVIAPFDGYCSTDILVLRANDGIDGGFAGKVMRTEHVGAAAEKTSVGTKMPRTSWKQLSALDVFCPRQPEQAQISRILDTLDTAIHETEAIIAKLKAVKQGLLYDLLTRGIDANGELRPPQVEAPHLYKESPLGWIPKEWSWGRLIDGLDGKPKNGYSPQEAPEWTGVQMLGLSCLTEDGFVPVQLKFAPQRDRRISGALLEQDDLLMSRANTRDLVGMVGVYKDVGTPCAYPDLMMRLKPSRDTCARFLQFVLQSARTRKQIQAHAVGTSGSMVKISGRIVSNLVVALPKKPEQGEILTRIAGCEEQRLAEDREARTLIAIKSGLMDDLLTGRVRVTPLLAQPDQRALEESI